MVPDPGNRFRYDTGYRLDGGSNTANRPGAVYRAVHRPVEPEKDNYFRRPLCHAVDGGAGRSVHNRLYPDMAHLRHHDR